MRLATTSKLLRMARPIWNPEVRAGVDSIRPKRLRKSAPGLCQFGLTRTFTSSSIHLLYALSWICITAIPCWAQSFAISTIAGNGGNGCAEDAGAAINAHITSPAGIAVDSSGNFYIADAANLRIRKVSANGIITTVAGNGIAAYSGDGGPATSAAIQITSFGQAASGVVVDGTGNLYIADSWNNRVRKVSITGTSSPRSPAREEARQYAGDGGLATSAQIGNPAGLAIDSAGNLYVSHYTAFDCIVRKVSATGVIYTHNRGRYVKSADTRATAVLRHFRLLFSTDLRA